MWAWWRTLTFLLPLLLLARANPAFQTDRESECGLPNPDSAVDDLVEQTKTLLEEPIDLPEKNGLINLVSGELWGLTTLNRSGPVSLSCNSSTVTLRFPMSATKPLRARYEWEKKVLKGVAYARTANLDLLVTVQAPRQFGDTEDIETGVARVTELSTERLGEVEVNVSGLAHVSWLWSRAVAFMTSVFENTVRRSVQYKLRVAMAEVLRRTASAEMQLL